MAIHYFSEDVGEVKFTKRAVSSWIKECIEYYEKKTGEINYIFCSDEYLKNMNIQYLRHDYYTDIITFNYNENNIISGDIYISIDRVSDNAQIFKVDLKTELFRVIIHGVLHLVGFDDKTNKLKDEMKLKENEWLDKLKI